VAGTLGHVKRLVNGSKENGPTEAVRRRCARSSHGRPHPTGTPSSHGLRGNERRSQTKDPRRFECLLRSRRKAPRHRPLCGTSEKVVGGWIAANGVASGVRVTTKGGHPDHLDGWRPRLGYDELVADARESRTNLGGAPIWCYVLHRDDPDRPTADIARTLATLVDEGLCRYVGVPTGAPRESSN
jgi:hypothetical protein